MCTRREMRGLVARDGYTFLLDQAYFTLREHFKVQSLDGFACEQMPAAIGAPRPSLPSLRPALPRCLGHTPRPLEQAYFSLREQFKVQSVDGFGCEQMPAAIGAAGAILHYLKTELRRSLGHISRLVVYRNSQFMVVDAATQANLELVQARGGGRDTSLLGCLDRTQTPMGARKLRDWILHPLCDLTALRERQQLIGDLLAEPFILGALRETLKSIRDLERTVGRLTQTGGNARDLQV